MTSQMSKTILAAVAAAFSAALVTVPATAADLGGSIKDAPAEEPKRRCSFSMNIGGTSDYVFRGISQTLEDPAAQGGVDATCGMFYAGVWASTVDFGKGPGSADIEVDLYAGIKPTWGPLTFDLGVIYYAYPNAKDNNVVVGEYDYVELKGGVSGTWNKITLGATLFYSPEYTGETGETLFTEVSAAYELPAVGAFTPSISGLFGHGEFFDNSGDYNYWNAGLSLAVDKFTFDFRYWDSDINSCSICDERFVFTAKVALP